MPQMLLFSIKLLHQMKCYCGENKIKNKNIFISEMFSSTWMTNEWLNIFNKKKKNQAN